MASIWKNSTIILSLLLLISATGVVIMHNRANKFAREATIWEHNYRAEKEGAVKKVLQKELEIEDILEDKRIDSTLQAEKIRKKDVRYIYTTQYRDTGSVKLQVKYVDVEQKWSNPIYGYYEEPCYSAYWTYFPQQDSIEHQWVIETDLQGTIFEQKENEFKVFKRTLFRYGDKLTFLTVTDHCSNKEIINNQLIKVKKKNNDK